LDMLTSWFSIGMALIAAAAASAQAVNITGTITDSAGAPLAGAAVQLERGGLPTTSGSDGKFSLTGTTGIASSAIPAPRAQLHSGMVFLELPSAQRVALTAYGVDGSALARSERDLQAGSHGLTPPGGGTGVRFYRVEGEGFSAVLRGLSLDGRVKSGSREAGASAAVAARAGLAKAAAGEMYDVITVVKSGYVKGYLDVAKAETTGVTIKLLKATAPKFSFFVASMRGLQALAKNENGFGGDLRFGETGAGAGLRGADKICATLAEGSLPGAYFKGWRAFLSVTADAYGKQANAIDRVGAGPWYDRLGRVLAPTLADLKNARPQNGDATIQNDLPNETGTLNHHPGPNGEEEDNHHMLTGSTTTGTLKSATATCKDWTTSVHSAANGKPYCGLAFPRGGGGGGGGGTANSHWMSAYEAPGCAAGIEVIIAAGPTQQAEAGGWIGGGGGYGGFYCFALNP
jgi:hypothetical protein